jgi:hypothetical protein
VVVVDIDRYFAALYGQMPDNARILVWTLKDKLSHTCTDVEDACRQVATLAGDIYTHVGFAPVGIRPKQRANSEQILGIPGVWLDLDVGTQGHKKPNNPPDLEAALSILDAFSLAPSLIVNSGGGLHAYWLLEEPWIFVQDADRTAAKHLLQRMGEIARRAAEPHGWAVDSVHDLARVLRVPGTYNHKHTPPIMAKILKPLDQRYDLLRFQKAMTTHAPATSLWSGQAPEPLPQQARLVPPVATVPELSSDLVVKARPSLPPGYDALYENNKKFQQTWMRLRRDMKDQSRSAYDLALANYAVQAQWPDQDILDLLVAWRHKHSEEIKDLAYYRRTIAKARKDNHLESAASRLDELLTDEAEPDFAARLNALSDALGVRIDRVEKVMSEPSSYSLHTNLGVVDLGGIEHIVSFSRFYNRVLEVLDHPLPMTLKKTWGALHPIIVQCAQHIEMEDSTRAGQAREWLERYLSRTAIASSPDEAVTTNIPFRDGNTTYVFLSHLESWLAVNVHPVQRHELCDILHAAGCFPARVHLANNAKVVRVWNTGTPIEG